MSGDKIKLSKIRDKVFMLHKESTLVVKSQNEKRCVVGRFENGKFVSIDDKTREICKEYAPEYKFYLDSDKQDASSEDESSDSSDEESPSVVEKSPPVAPPTLKKESDEEDDDSKSSDEEEAVHHSTPANSPMTTPQAEPVKIEFVANDKFSLNSTPVTLHSTPLDFFQTFQESFNDYVEQKKEEIAVLEKRKSSLLTQVETMEKQIRAIKSMFM